MRTSFVLVVVVSLGCGDAKTHVTAPIASASATRAITAKLAAREDATLPSRAIFFGNPDRTRVRISPDGTKIAYLANENGVLNVVVAKSDDPTQTTVVTHVTKRNVHSYEWSMDSKTIVYAVDENGDENWWLRAASADGKNDRALVGQDGVRVVIEHVSPKRPGEIVVGVNRDLYVLDLASGNKTLLKKNDGFERFVVDDDFRVRFALLARQDGGVDVEEPNGAAWKTFTTIPMEDRVATKLVGFDKNETTLDMLDSRGRDTAAVVTLDLKTKKSTVLLDDGAADVEFLLVQPTDKTIQAAEANYDRTRWHVVDRSIQPDFDFLRTVDHGDLAITSRSLDDKRWLVAYATEGPTRYYVFDRTKQAATFLFTSNDALGTVALATMTPLTIRSRDGLDLPSYVTLPLAKTKTPPPLVVLVQSRVRASWGYSATTQWLASRGYAVLQVNQRGSPGFGKRFENAGNLEWGGKMHDDVLDAVKWVTDQKWADPSRVAIYGAGYGGYEALVGLAFTPNAFACAVDVEGPSNLLTYVASAPELAKRIGDPRTEDGKKLLWSRSPLSRASSIRAPLLVGRGKNDPDTERLVSEVAKNGVVVKELVYPDEDHGAWRPEDRESFAAAAEIFLAQCLGGSYAR
jgi:dipeptidyl aminopeptidase/acylaminoacyl peptidase